MTTTVRHQGKTYMLSQAGANALDALGPDVAAGKMTGEEAVEHILRCDGALEPIPEGVVSASDERRPRETQE